MIFVFFSGSGGYLKGYFEGSHILYAGGYFCKRWAFLFCSWSSGSHRGFSNVPWRKTCLEAWYQVRFVWKYFWAVSAPCVRGRGRPWYGISAQPESHFTCSSPRCATRRVPSTLHQDYFWAFLGGTGGVAEGRPKCGTLAKPKGHFTQGMFKKC